MAGHEPTPAEQKVIDRWTAAMETGRKNMEAMIAGGSILSYAEVWRQTNAPALPPFFTVSQQKKIQALIDSWNQLEIIYARAASGQYGCQIWPDGTDLDVGTLVSEEAPPIWQPPAIEAFWIPVIIIIVLIAGAVTATTSINHFTRKNAEESAERLAKLDAEMIKDPKTAQSWATFKKTTPSYPEEKGILDSLTPTLPGLDKTLPLIVLAAVVLLALSQGKQRAREVTTEQVEATATNPRRLYRKRIKRQGKPYLVVGPRPFVESFR